MLWGAPDRRDDHQGMPSEETSRRWWPAGIVLKRTGTSLRLHGCRRPAGLWVCVETGYGVPEVEGAVRSWGWHPRLSKFALRAGDCQVWRAQTQVRTIRTAVWTSRIAVRKAQTAVWMNGTSVRKSQTSVRKAGTTVRKAQTAVWTNGTAVWTNRIAVREAQTSVWTSQTAVW